MKDLLKPINLIYYNKTYISLLVFVILSLQIKAQTADSLRVVIEDHHIEKMNNKIAVDVSLNNAFNTFELKNGDLNYRITPNIPANIKFKVNYDFLSLGVQFKTIHEDIELKGESKSFNIGAGIILKHFFTDINYNKQSGYYLENTKDHILNWKAGDPYIQFPDLHYSSFSIASGYSFNSKFSIRSIRSQTERQLKSTGSFIPVVNFDYFIIDDRAVNLNNFSETSHNLELTIGPGYAHTFVIKEKVYASLGFSLSLGIINTKSTIRAALETIEDQENGLVTRVNTRLGLGYNGFNYYYGVFGNISASQINNEDDNKSGSFTNSRFYFNVFFGKRFKAPDYLKRTMKKIKPF